MYFFCNLYYGAGSALIFLILLKKFFNGAQNRHFSNLKNKIIIITGSNAGIGKATAEELYKLGANVILACRSKEKTMEVIKEIKENTKKNSEIEFMELDLQDLQSVKQFATNFKKRFNKCDILINNAGVFMDQRQVSKQNHEMTFATNHLGHFLLTQLLMSHLKQSDQGRIINVSSNAHTFYDIDFSDYQNVKSYKGFKSYGQSKLMNVYFTRELAKRLKDQKVQNLKVVSLHPGVVRTEIARNMKPVLKLLMAFFSPIWFYFSKSIWYGAQTTLHCALIEFDQLEQGAYFDECKVKKEKLNSKWEKEAFQLWQISEELTKQFL